MRFEIITIFPGFFAGIFEHGIVRRAQAEGLVGVGLHDLRTFTHDRHRTVDDRPFGGGEGMVLKPEPLAEALKSLGIEAKHKSEQNQKQFLRAAEESRSAQDDTREVSGTRVILLSAQGRPFTQAVARELSQLERVVLICGRYEGVDERINELYCDLEISIGDYVLSGGELAAAVVVDTVMRLVPGVLGNEASGEFESFGVADAEISSGRSGRASIAARCGRTARLSALHAAGGVRWFASAGSADEWRSPADSPLAARTAVAEDLEEQTGSAGARGSQRRGPEAA